MINTTAPRSTDAAQHMVGRHEAEFDVVDAVGQLSRPGHVALRVIALRVRQAGLALLGVWRMSGNPAFFDFNRRPRAATHLGAGVTWEADSFWAASSYPYA